MQVPKENRIGVGYRVGKLTVLEKTNQRKNRYVVWRCRCDCGGEILLDTRYLQRETVMDCGCQGRVNPKQKDLTGMRFGKLVCLKHTRERDANNCTIWICRCDCGNLCKVSTKQLLSRQKKSCGCLDIDAGDHIGRRFDALTVVGYAGRSGRKNQWRCRCDCGREVVALQSDLSDGRVHSCGCLREAVRSGKLKFADGTVVPFRNCSRGMPVENYYNSFPGVRYVPEARKWSAEIIYRGETYHLGDYAELADAIRARQASEEMYGNFLEWYHHGRGTKKASGG